MVFVNDTSSIYRDIQKIFDLFKINFAEKHGGSSCLLVNGQAGMAAVIVP